MGFEFTALSKFIRVWIHKIPAFQGGATHVDIACDAELVKLATSLTGLPVSDMKHIKSSRTRMHKLELLFFLIGLVRTITYPILVDLLTCISNVHLVM